jgi:hypothetical protein
MTFILKSMEKTKNNRSTEKNKPLGYPVTSVILQILITEKERKKTCIRV